MRLIPEGMSIPQGLRDSPARKESGGGRLLAFNAIVFSVQL